MRVPDTVTAAPSGIAARSWTTLRKFSLSGAVVSSTPTPRVCASTGTLTNVTWSSTTSVNKPRSAASGSTPTSAAASSPATSTVTEDGSRPDSA